MIEAENEMKAISGRHLIIDAYVKDGAILNNPDTLCSLFDELVHELDMEYLQRPAAYRVPTDPKRLANDEDDGGWSVICQITTSHIALHGWPLRNAFMMDVFSCHDFDAKRAQALIWERLGVTDATVRDIERTDPRASQEQNPAHLAA
jgi:S-adenosylmethionine decarboxylase